MSKKVVSIAIAAIFAMTPMSAMGATSDEIQEDINATEEELNQVKAEESETLDSQQELQDELDNIHAEITELNDEIDELGNVTFREVVSEMPLEIVHSLKNFFHSDSENKNETRREQIDADNDQLETLQAELETVSEEFDESSQAVTDLESKQADLAEQITDLQKECDAAFVEEEYERLEAACTATDEEAARLAEKAKEAEEKAQEEKAQEEAAAQAETKESAAQSEGDSNSEGNPPVETATSDSYDMPSGSGILTWSGGVNYFNGHMETWYTMREWKGDLGIPGMYIGTDGIVRDCDNYICVASDDDPKGTVLETSLGTAKVYDCGPGHGIIDIYTDWPLY